MLLLKSGEYLMPSNGMQHFQCQKVSGTQAYIVSDSVQPRPK